MFSVFLSDQIIDYLVLPTFLEGVVIFSFCCRALRRCIIEWQLWDFFDIRTKCYEFVFHYIPWGMLFLFSFISKIVLLTYVLTHFFSFSIELFSFYEFVYFLLILLLIVIINPSGQVGCRGYFNFLTYVETCVQKCDHFWRKFHDLLWR